MIDAGRRRALASAGQASLLWALGAGGLSPLTASAARPAPAASSATVLSASPSIGGFELRYAGYLDSGRSGSLPIGEASYRFDPEGDRYRVVMNVRSGLGTLDFESSGQFDAAGLHPRRLHEARRMLMRPPSERTVEFEEKAAVAGGQGAGNRLVVPRGAQDKISVIAQLSILPRIEPAVYARGKPLVLPYASWDSVEPVALTIGPVEPVGIEGGRTVQARRIRRDNDQGGAPVIDVWIAESGERLPVVIRFVEGGGSLRFALKSG